MRKVVTSRAPECTVQKYIGSAYDNVKVVADNIDEVIDCADNLPKIDTILPHVGDINTVASNIADVTTVADNVADVVLVGDHITDVSSVGSNIADVIIAANNIQDIINAPQHAQDAIDSANAAKVSETNAKTSETNAKTSETNSSNSELVATTKAQEAGASATAAKASEVAAQASEQAAETAKDAAEDAQHKSEIIYEAFMKGAVYRGGWNPKIQTYPDPAGTNSQWDVYLDAGTDHVDFDGKTWYAGDRLIWSEPDQKFFHITRVAGVLSVNGKTGSVIITPHDLDVYTVTEVDENIKQATGYCGDWLDNPILKNKGDFVYHKLSKKRFTSIVLPYQVNSTQHPDPNILVGTELNDISSFISAEQARDLIKTTSPEVFGNTDVVKGSTGSATAFRQNPDEYSADKATRIYIEPREDVIDEDDAVGGAIKIFSVPFTDVGPARYQDFGLYYSSGQNGDKGYYGRGVFYLNSKALGVNNPDIACTFQDGVYQAWKATLLPGSAEGGNRAVTVFGKRNSTTAYALNKCHIEYNGWVGFDNSSSGLAWWGINGNFENKISCFVDSGKNAFQVTLGNSKAIKHNGEVFEVCKNDGSVAFSLDLSGTDQGALFQTRVVGRQASTNAVALSVAGLNSLVLNYSGATTLTELRDGVEGQCVTILSGNSNATIQHNATIRLKKGDDYNIPPESAIQLIYSGLHGKWFEIGASA